MKRNKLTLKLYLNTLKLLHDSSEELGLDHLKPSDRLVMLALYERKDSKGFIYGSYNKILKEGFAGGVEISRAKFYQSLNSLLSLNVISRVKGERSQIYKWHGD